MNNSYPQARTADLVISELPDEVLVYDLKTHQAHCLNQMAGLVWRHCDGKSSIDEIVRRIEVQEKTLLEENAVWAALEQLSQNNLLIETVKRPADVPAFSRRRAMRRIGLGAVLAVPLVMSVSAPLAAQAGTCGTCANNSVATCLNVSGGGNSCPANCASCLGTCWDDANCKKVIISSSLSCAACDVLTSGGGWHKN